MKKQATKAVAKGIKTVLDMVLRIEANTTSCGWVYQPQEPDGLKKYRKWNKAE